MIEKNKENIIDESKNLGENLDEVFDEKNHDFNLYINSNPFQGVVIGGEVLGGTGIVSIAGGITTVIAMDSFLITYTAGYAFVIYGGFLATGLGAIVAVPGLIGFGAYKIYKSIKDKKRKIFFENINSDEKKVEREFQSYVI